MRNERPTNMIDPRWRADPDFYARIAAHERYTKVDEAVVEPFTGRGFRVPKGHAARFVLVDGPQVADVGFWSAADPRETLDAARTQLLEGFVMRPPYRLWSDVPWLRPIATCIADTVGERFPDEEYCHHWVGTQCAPEWIELRGGGRGKNSCRSNLLQAIEPFGLQETDIRQNVSIHQKGRINSRDWKFYDAPSQGVSGDYVEFYSEIDLVVGVGICPNADNGYYWSDPEDGLNKPIKVEIYDTGIAPQEFPSWYDWRKSWRGEWAPLAESQAARSPEPAG